MSDVIDKFLLDLKATNKLAVDIEHNPDIGFYDPAFKIHGCGFYNGKTALYVKTMDAAREIISVAFPDPTCEIITHNGKYDIQGLQIAGWSDDYPVNFVDTMMALNLLEDNRHPNALGLKRVVLEVFGHNMTTFEDALAFGMDSPQFTKYGAEDVVWTYRLWEELKPKLIEQKLLKYLQNIPAFKLFADIERSGIKWDLDKARKLLRGYTGIRDKLEAEIFEEIGPLNINSGDQIARRLFDELGYPSEGLKRTKKRVSTDADTMDLLASRFPVCKKISQYKTADKLVSTYVVPLSESAMSSPDQRIHPTFWLVSSTGRTRSSNPNLQNQPAYLDPLFDGHSIRKAFVPRPGYKFIVADLSMIELRLVAQYTADPMFLDAFRNWQCTSCGNTGMSTTILHTCPKCGIVENENVIHPKNPELGFWHGLDLHSMTANSVSALGGNRQLGKCVDPDTLVCVGGKYQRIGQLHPGRSADTYYDFTGHIESGTGTHNKITSFYSAGDKLAYLIVTSKGIIVQSGTHRLMTPSGWQNRDGIVEQGCVVMADMPPIPLTGHVSKQFNPFFPPHKYSGVQALARVDLDAKWAYMAGLFIGDGTFATSDSIKFIGGGIRVDDYAWAEVYKNSIESCGLLVSSTSYADDGSTYSYSVGSRNVGNFFKDVLHLYPKKGYEIKIPEWVFTSQELVRAFIGGLFDTDGYIGKPGKRAVAECSICTKSWQLAADLMTLLRACGDDRCRLRVSKNKKYNKDYYLVYPSVTFMKKVNAEGYIRHPYKSSRIAAQPDYCFEPKDTHIGKVIRVLPLGTRPLVDVAVLEASHDYMAGGFHSHNTANFALVYAASAKRMHAEHPEISVPGWAKIIDEYFNVYSSVRQWHTRVSYELQTCYDKFYEVLDIFGRKRRISTEEARSSFKHCLNQAVNFGPQSSACGMIQLSLTRFREDMRSMGIWMDKVFPVNMIHDEIVLEVAEDQIENVLPPLIHRLEHSVSLEVPCRTSINIVDSWGDAK